MIRRFAVLVAVLSFATMVGCGLLRNQQLDRLADRPGAVTWVFDAPMPRVLDAARDSLGEIVLDFVSPLSFDMSIDPNDKLPKGVVYKKEENYYEFDPEQFDTDMWVIEGTTKNERHVKVLLKSRDENKRCDVTIMVGDKGDLAMSEAYLNRLTDRLAHPVIRTVEELEKRKLAIAIEFDFKTAKKAASPPTDRP